MLDDSGSMRGGYINIIYKFYDGPWDDLIKAFTKFV